MSRSTLLAGMVLLAALEPVIAAPKTGVKDVDPISLYGEEILFDVFRNDIKSGKHKVTFARQGDELAVEVRFDLTVRFLFFNAYRFQYRSWALWTASGLKNIRASVYDDGKKFSFEAFRRGDGLTVQSTGRSHELDQPIFPTNHWNAGVLGQSQVLNTLTGRPNDVHIVRQGRETITTERGKIEATRYRYTGQLRTTVWYDDWGRWVKMRFKGRDGSTIDYRCRKCQGGSQAAYAIR